MAWTPFPHDARAFRHEAAGLKQHWARLHAGDAEPLPKAAAVLAAWGLFHAGDFEAAVAAGRKAGGAGLVVAMKAQCIHATYLEPKEKVRLDRYLEVAEWAKGLQAEQPGWAGAWYWEAYALGRYSQGISVAKALAQGLGAQVKGALERAIALAPAHADAHIALGAFHAEVIDKVGKLLGKTQGADAATGLRLFRRALELNPGSAIARIEYANGLVMIEGEKRLKEAEALYAEAAALEPADATEKLDIELAREELAED